jgi:hypothetical protein
MRLDIQAVSRALSSTVMIFQDPEAHGRGVAGECATGLDKLWAAEGLL